MNGETTLISKKLASETDFTDITKDQLISDFKVVIADAEALLKATANQGGEAMAAVPRKSRGVTRCRQRKKWPTPRLR